MYNFEGEYRRTPQQNLAGASKQEKVNELIKRAQEERRHREELRLKEKAARKIQSFVRGTLTRLSLTRKLRFQFDEKVKELTRQGLLESPEIVFNEEHLGYLMSRLLLVYSSSLDGRRLEFMSQILLHHYQNIVVSPRLDDLWLWRIRFFIRCHLIHIYYSTNLEDIMKTKSLSILVTYTSLVKASQEMGASAGKSYISKVYRFSIEQGLFAMLRQTVGLIPENFNPSSLDLQSPEWLLVEMLTRPFTVIPSLGDTNLMFLLIENYSSVVFCNPLPNLIEKVVLPLLREIEDFPLAQVITSLQERNIGASPHALYCILYLDHSQSSITDEMLDEYFEFVSFHTIGFQSIGNNVDIYGSAEEIHVKVEFDDDEDLSILGSCALLLNDRTRVNNLVRVLRENLTNSSILLPMARFFHNLLLYRNGALHFFKILTYMAMHPEIQRSLWQSIQSLKRVSIFLEPRPLTSVIAFGLKLTDEEATAIVPMLTTFCSVFRFYLATIQDEEFYQSPESGSPTTLRPMPFSIPELVELSRNLRDVALGLLELAYPEPRLAARDQYEQFNLPTESSVYSVGVWTYLFKEVVALVKLLYVRDVRRQYTPENHWVSSKVSLPSLFPLSSQQRLSRRVLPFQYSASVTRFNIDSPPLSVSDNRLLTLLKELPFTLSFLQRVNVLQRLLAGDKVVHQNELSLFNLTMTPISIRRDYIYEDAFEKLNSEAFEEIKGILKIHLVSNLGTDEAGVDGGGVFREFLISLLKTAFDPNRGFFLLNRENQLYPNPNVRALHPNFTSHYFFIGRMLGKAIYEGLLCEIPFAEFFLAKLVGANIDLYLNSLASLDPEVYRNLMYLRTYSGDFSDIGLDFTIVIDDFGQNKVVDLKPNGSEILVNDQNKIEYIHLVADYKMNKQIKQQCAAFQKGISSVVLIEWLSMFSTKELQTLISGTECPINIEDFENHTVYSGGFTADHPNIKMFWSVIRTFKSEEVGQLLKFVTSCSRPPLLGFRHLEPPFCVQLVEGGGDRLPTSSTCMNLLLLPIFKDAQTMRQKLLYAIQSGAGFELI